MRLLRLYRHSLNTGEIPADWKRATVTTISKKGSKSDPENCRPVPYRLGSFFSFFNTQNMWSRLELIPVAGRPVSGNFVTEQEHNFVTTAYSFWLGLVES